MYKLILVFLTLFLLSFKVDAKQFDDKKCEQILKNYNIVIKHGIMSKSYLYEEKTEIKNNKN